MRTFCSSVYGKIVRHRWELGFVEKSIYEIIQGDDLRIRYVKYPFHGRWFADPFILDYNEDEIFLLVEDYSDADKKGKITKLQIDRKSMRLKDAKIILELDSHLSFPAIMRLDGKVFIYPENSAGKGLALYEYNQKTDECHEVKVITRKPLTDAIITSYFGRKQVFSTRGLDANKNVLEVFDLLENGDVSKTAQVVFDENIARNAGDFFEHEGQLYRVAQESNFTYGHALSIQQITKEGETVKMKEVRRILPMNGAFGIHTFNKYGELTVVDLKVFRHPWIAKPLFWVRNLFK